MTKSNQIKKLVNGEIADADDVNQIVENAGSEGGLIPYDPTSHERSTDGSQSVGSVAYPLGSIKVNRNAELVEVDPVGHTAASTVKISDLRKFISQKDTPSSYSGYGGRGVTVKDDESGLEFTESSNVEIFTSNGNFTVPTGITKVYVTLLGGGGGGAAGGEVSGADAGGGGGGGGSVINYPYSVTGSQVCAVVIGAGGNGGVAAVGGNNGSDGSASTFDGSVSAPGGNGGVKSSGPGDTGAGGASNLADGSGQTGGVAAIAPGAGSAAASATIGGGGGGSSFGAGANGGNATAGSAASSNSGGGGGGGGRNTGGTAGGNGGSGLCIVMW